MPQKNHSKNIVLGTALVLLTGIYLLMQDEESSSIQQKPVAEADQVAEDEPPALRETVETESGLQYRVLRSGSGPSPRPENQVRVHYRGRLENGKEFDSSYRRGRPATFPVNGVIRGWTEALLLMKEGDKWELTIPPELGYGSRGVKNAIPPDSILIFEVELLEIL